MDELTTTDTISLQILKTIANETNHRILNVLPTSINRIMNLCGLTKVPANAHINQLERCGLVHRFRGTGEIQITPFGDRVLHIIDIDLGYLIDQNETELIKLMIK